MTDREYLEALVAGEPDLVTAVELLGRLEAKYGRPQARNADRWDHNLIAQLVPRGASVLDLGCGDGALLEQLMRERDCRGQGVDVDQDHIVSCVQRGVPVIQSDLDDALPGFPDASYDYVVLEETLQTVRLPNQVLREMLRIGRTGIVSFPNFGHWWIRAQLLLEGRMPMSPRLNQGWHETTNIHLFTVRDFEDWCRANGAFVHQRFTYADGQVRLLVPGDNLMAEEALFVIGPADSNML